MKVALTGGSKDRLVEQVHVADYLLYKLNKSKKCRENYVEFLGLNEPSNSIDDVLIELATLKKFYVGGARTRLTVKSIGDQFNGLDVERAADVFIRAFRKGDLGVITLDDCSPSALDKWFEEDLEENESVLGQV